MPTTRRMQNATAPATAPLVSAYVGWWRTPGGTWQAVVSADTYRETMHLLLNEGDRRGGDCDLTVMPFGKAP